MSFCKIHTMDLPEHILLDYVLLQQPLLKILPERQPDLIQLCPYPLDRQCRISKHAYATLCGAVGQNSHFQQELMPSACAGLQQESKQSFQVSFASSRSLFGLHWQVWD